MDFRDNCGIVYDPRIIETVKNVQVQFYPDFLQNTSFLLSLDKPKKSDFIGLFCLYILASEQRDVFRHPAVMILLYYCTSAFILSLYSGAQYSWSMYSSVLSFDTASALSKDFLHYFTDSPWSRLSAKRT